MAFRNPVRSLPASRITGQLTGAQIVDGAITFPHLKGPLSSAAAVRYLDVMDDASLWERISSPGSWGVVVSTDATTGGTVLQATGETNLRSRVRIPHDPEVLYRVSVRVRTRTEGSAVPTVYLGLYGFAADGVTTVSRNGIVEIGNQAYACAYAQKVPAASGWVTYTGYVRGRVASGSAPFGPNPKMTSPLTLHTNVRFVAPYVRLDYPNPAVTGSVIEVDRVSVDAVYTGVVTAEAVEAGAIDGQTITGTTIRTAASGRRIQLDPDGNLYFYPADPLQAPGAIRVDAADGTLQLVGPNGDGVDYGVTFQKAFGETSATFDTDQVYCVGSMFADNIRTGRVTITPSAANTPTPATLSGLGMSGTGAVRAVATAVTTLPGTAVTGVGCTNPSRDGVTIWLTRTSTTATSVEYVLFGE